MPNMTMSGTVLVSIVNLIMQVSPPAWQMEYEVRNLEASEIWLVVGESLMLKHDNKQIELSYARGKMQPGVQVFGYFDPQVVKIPAGGSLRRSVEINWPCRLSDIWNEVREVELSPGEYEVSVRIGFALTAKPKAPKVGEDVEDPVLRWQKTAVSPPMQVVHKWSQHQ